MASLRVAGLTYRDASGVPIGSATDRYIHMTGTSASAAFVSGVAALVMSAHKRFGPTEVKGAIVASGRPVQGSVTTAVDASAALVRTGTANAGLHPSRLLVMLLATSHALKLKGVTWEGVTWEGITWDGITWDGVTWESLTWESIRWESVSWESVSWETVRWEGVTWAKRVTTR